MPNDATAQASKQPRALSRQTQQRLVQFVWPLLVSLNQQLDVRLVRSFLATLFAIVQWRSRSHGLLLSELGASITSPERAPAGTKRLSNLLRSPAWAAHLIGQLLSAVRGRLAGLRYPCVLLSGLLAGCAGAPAAVGQTAVVPTPSLAPTEVPTLAPSMIPKPSEAPTEAPTKVPTAVPQPPTVTPEPPSRLRRRRGSAAA
jgi:cell division septation protein DedD